MEKKMENVMETVVIYGLKELNLSCYYRGDLFIYYTDPLLTLSSLTATQFRV